MEGLLFTWEPRAEAACNFRQGNLGQRHFIYWWTL